MIPLKDDNPRSAFPILTITLIAVNILAFLLELQFGLEYVVMKYGAIPIEIVNGQDLETMFTSMFLHGGSMHLAGNMLYLWIFGDNIESYLGRFKFILFYLICGLIAIFAHIIVSGSSEVPMVGASGAISGILGAYLIKYPKAKVLVLIPIIFFITVRRIPALFVLGFWFIMQLFSGVVTIGGEGGGVAFWAHIGGFVAGLGLILLLSEKKRKVVSYN